MSRSNKILIIQLICMYMIHLPFYIAIILVKFSDISFETIRTLITIGFIAILLTIPVCVVSFIFAIMNLARDEASPTKITLIVKISLIPWYIVNLLVCLFLIVGFLNPWLMIAVPLLIGMEIGITYTFMLSTSMHTIFYMARKLLSDKVKPDKKITIAMTFLFVFCLDIVGIMILHREYKKQNIKID